MNVLQIVTRQIIMLKPIESKGRKTMFIVVSKVTTQQIKV